MRVHSAITTMGLLVTVALALAPDRTAADPIPFQKALESLDGPQPHGPGNGLLVDHQPHNFSGPASDTMAFEVPGSSIVAQYVADDFILPTQSDVRRVSFWGFFNFGIEPVGNEVFEVKFHDSRPGDGLPGNVLYQTSITNPSRDWTGRFIIDSGSPREYKYTIDLTLPFTVNAGESIWLSIYQVGDPLSSFRWEHSVNGDPNGHAFNNQFVGDWTLAPWPQGGNTAFQLFSTPEPSSCTFLLLATIWLGCQSRERGSVI